MEEEEAKEAQSRLLIRRRGRSSASKVEHSVEDLSGDGDLGGAGLVAVETQPVTDDLLPARELALNLSPLIIAAVPLPGHSPFSGDRLDMAVALGRVGVGRGAEHGISAGWNDHLRVRMPLFQSGINPGSVITAVAQEELDRLGDLVKQGLDLRGVIDVTFGQDGSDDPAAYRVEADVQLAPGAPLAGTVLLNQPLARTAQLQPRTVDQQVDRSASRAGLRRQSQALSAPAEGREIRYRQIEAEQLEDRADQSLGLAQRQVENSAERQSCRNCEVGVVGLT